MLVYNGQCVMNSLLIYRAACLCVMMSYIYVLVRLHLPCVVDYVRYTPQCALILGIYKYYTIHHCIEYRPLTLFVFSLS